MTSRVERRFRPSLRATLALLPALALLLGLGLWQLDRLAEKRALVAELRARREAPAIDLPRPVEAPRALEYRRVRLAGRYLHGRELYVGARPYRGRPGYHVVTPLRLADGRAVLVERGWVPKDRRAPASRPAGQVEGRVSIQGIVRTGGWPGSDWLRPANDPESNVWLWMDLPAMAAAARLADPVTEVYVTLAADDAPGPLPVVRPVPVERRNPHLQYALTWFALAGVLLGIFVLYHWHRPGDGPEGG